MQIKSPKEITGGAKILLVVVSLIIFLPILLIAALFYMLWGVILYASVWLMWGNNTYCLSILTAPFGKIIWKEKSFPT